MSEDSNEQLHGHVTSISVLRTYRRLGLAKKLMIQSRTYLLSTIYLLPYLPRVKRKLWLQYMALRTSLYTSASLTERLLVCIATH